MKDSISVSSMKYSIIFMFLGAEMCVLEQGAYRTDEGKPMVLDCVRQAEARIAGSNFM